MKIVVAPDKFKDTLTAKQACEAMAAGITQFDSSIEVIQCPIADGGEGTLEVLEVALNLERVDLVVSNPIGRPIEAWYLEGRGEVYIEMAKATGLQLLNAAERNPESTSSFGTGELIRHAINRGSTKVHLFIGGSATNDAGIGMLSALGFVFKDIDGEALLPKGSSLGDIHSIETSQGQLTVDGVGFNIYCDVNNALLGPKGAAFVFARQKGANDEMVTRLDHGLKHLAQLLNNGFEDQAGAGAAGGVGFGAISFLNAELKSGIDFILDHNGFDQAFSDADFVITGEGKLDSQSLEGKVIAGVNKRTRLAKVPMGIICGEMESSKELRRRLEPTYISTLVSAEISKEHALSNASVLLSQRTREMLENLSPTLF